MHQHLWPPSLITALQSRDRRPRLRGRMLELPGGDWEIDLAAHDLAARLAALDGNEIDVAVISCPPTLELDPDLIESYQEGVLGLVAAAGGRVRPFACNAARDGFSGACVSALALDNLAALAPLLAALEERGKLIFVHPSPALTTTHSPAWRP